jgi:hypothetical protein
MAMEELGIPAKLVRLTKAPLKTVKCKVKVKNDYITIPRSTNWFARGKQFGMLTTSFTILL